MKQITAFTILWTLTVLIVILFGYIFNKSKKEKMKWTKEDSQMISIFIAGLIVGVFLGMSILSIIAYYIPLW